jgi:IS1 family transposase
VNKISKERKIQILSGLVEGMSIRSLERMTNTHRDTIIRLMVRIGKGCQRLLEENIKGFHSKHIEVDEIWTFVKKKEKKLNLVEKTSQQLGDQYVFVALDAETKLVPVFMVGKRDSGTATVFMQELQKRLKDNGRIQITTDSLKAYLWAVELAFGRDVDYAQLTKLFTTVNPGFGRYSPPRISQVVSTTVQGNPNEKHVSTSYVERNNLTIRMQIRRFTRLTNAFSKKLDNLKASLALHFAHYNFMRIHKTLRCTPAMESGITDHIWGWDEILFYEI